MRLREGYNISLEKEACQPVAGYIAEKGVHSEKRERDAVLLILRQDGKVSNYTKNLVIILTSEYTVEIKYKLGKNVYK